MKTPNINNCIPVGNTILVKPIDDKNVIDGIYIPDNCVDQTTYKVVKLGNMFKCEHIEVGMKVLIAGKGGDALNIQGDMYWVYPVENVIAIVGE
jgi:co-chaperonin GroES (HSP10)